MENEKKQGVSRDSEELLERSLTYLDSSLDQLKQYLKRLNLKNFDTGYKRIDELKINSEELLGEIKSFYAFKNSLNNFLEAYNELEISKDFNSKLNEPQQDDDDYQDAITEFKNCLRQVIEDLTSHDILTYNLSWPRRYLYERACHGKLQEYRNGFIYKALQSYKNLNNLKEKSLQKQWEKLDKAFKEFYEIIPASPCLRTAKGEEEIKEKSLGQRAFDVSNSLLRIFFFGGTAENLLRCWEKYEDLIYFAEEKYRDHCLHLFYDFLLGCVILESLLPRIHHYWECYTGGHINLDEVYVRIMRRWLITSLFHDIGYTAQSLKNVSGKIEKEFFTKVPGFNIKELGFKNKPPKSQIEDFCKSLANILSEDEFSFKSGGGGDEEKNKDLCESTYMHDFPVYHATVNLLIDQLEKMDHGVMSALFLLLVSRIDIHELTLNVSLESKLSDYDHNHEEFKKEREKIEQDIEVATLAIAIHNMRQADVEGITIDFRSHPITFLLMLCDDLHEWDREPEWKKKEETITNVYGFNVFRRLDDPRDLFKRETRYNDGAEDETLFNFLFRYMAAPIGEKRYSKEGLEKFRNKLEDEIEERLGSIERTRSDFDENQKECLSGQLKKLLDGGIPLDNIGDIKDSIDKWIEEQKVEEKKETEEEKKEEIKELKDFIRKLKIIRMALVQNKNDVITFIYAGGDEKKRGQEGDRITKMWETFKKLSIDNLSHGPAICILHTYNGDESETDKHEHEFFFIAEYDEALKVYEVDKDLEPKRNSLT